MDASASRRRRRNGSKRGIRWACPSKLPPGRERLARPTPPMASSLLIALAVLALLVGWLALRAAGRARRSAGLPAGRIVYADTGDWRPLEKPLCSSEHGLTGKPDYLVQTRSGLVPVEVKSGAAPARPYP